MSEKILKVFDVEIKTVNAEDKSVEVVVSTENKDRHGDIVLADSFRKRLKYYKEHPVLLSSHDYYSLQSNIGKASSIKVTENGLVAKFEYFTGKGNAEADWAFELAQRGIAAFSIGFMAHEFDWIKEKNADGNEFITGRKFTDVELLEISQVTIPSNRQSVQNMIGLNEGQAQLAQIAIKNFKDEEWKPIITKPEIKTEDKTDSAVEEPHYSEEVLAPGAGKTAPITESIQGEDLRKAILEGIDNAVQELKNGN